MKIKNDNDKTVVMLIHLHDIENENSLFEKTMGGVHEILIHP